ncbi:hypothetical protein Pint_09550 [Pistacia integerrima]|uniref:Uncharacterized protein n=1 Tax=Pistacia integerrima TaxID=434235 RepID=A0ACC0XG27_9ROSI|nr:hypothetical protein Pint_09550 [Pistacia integerrima]
MGELFRSFLSKLIALLGFILLFQSCWLQMVTTESSAGEILKDSSCSNNDTRVPDDEKKALKKLVDKLGYQSNSNQDSTMKDTRSSPICSYSCNNNVCHVTDITMRSSKLDGTIDGKALSKLQYLEYLDLSGNQIHGAIPPALNNLTRLQYILLFSNRISGTIPSNLSNLSQLQVLDLSKNRIHGIIPPTVNDLSSLTHIYLGSNQLNGSLPDMQNMKNLVAISFTSNFLEGIIPKSLGQLPSLKNLYLGINLLTGEIPAELGNLSKLEYLNLEENLLVGNLTPALGNLKNLLALSVASNNLTGILPDNLVAGNKFSGSIPQYITDWKKLKVLNLLGNEFEKLPSDIFHMSELRLLLVSDVNIRGSSFKMPELIHLTNIKRLIIRNCFNTGVIPTNIGSCSNLTYLDLSFNNLTGGIPKSMENLKLNKLILTSNMLNGTVNDSWIKKMKLASSIQTMSKAFCQDKHGKHDSLRINCGGSSKVVGAEDEYEADDHKSKIFESSDHRWAYVCTGDFYFADASYKDYIKNASCRLSPSEESIYETARLCPQSLKYYGFCLQNGDYNVRLHFSEIVFSNPKDQSNLGKRIFDINVQGKMERKDFSIKDLKATNKSFIDINTTVDEDSLLTIHFFWAGKGSIYLPNNLNGPLISAINVTRVYPVTKGRRGLSTGQIIGIVIGSVLAASLLLLAFMWRIGWIGDRELRVTSVKLRDKWYTLKQVKDATRNFSSRNEIGQGRFGIVYKAELPDQTVAVKKLSLQSNLDQIGTEVYALKNLKHDNLVELLDAYSKKDMHLLIYEYMERGSLEKALFVFLQACYLQAKGRLMDLVDKKLSTYNWQQAHDILHLAMMCVDQSPAVRPTMSEVVSVLEGEKNIQQISKADTSSA